MVSDSDKLLTVTTREERYNSNSSTAVVLTIRVGNFTRVTSNADGTQVFCYGHGWFGVLESAASLISQLASCGVSVGT